MKKLLFTITLLFTLSITSQKANAQANFDTIHYYIGEIRLWDTFHIPIEPNDRIGGYSATLQRIGQNDYHAFFRLIYLTKSYYERIGDILVYKSQLPHKLFLIHAIVLP
jgi:hypothetical protein